MSKNERERKIGMEQMRIKKLIAMLIVFVIVFSNFGYTISAIATTNGFEIITHAFFGKEEISFEAYFEENEKNVSERISNVNQTIQLKMQISPEIEGYLKNATIKAVTENGETPNFRIKDIKTYSTDVEIKQDNDKIVNVDKEKESVENVIENTAKNETENSVVNEISEDKKEISNEIIENKDENVISNETTDSLVVEETTNTIENETKEHDVKEEVINNTTDFVSINQEEKEIEVKDDFISIDAVKSVNETENETDKELEKVDEKENVDSSIPVEEEEVLIDEEKIIEEKSAEAEEEIVDFTSDVQIVSDNEVSISNVVEETVYVLEIEYMQEEEFKPENLHKDIYLQLSGTFINNDLEKIEVKKEEKITVGWEYSKDIQLNSEYTKVSPFKIGEIVGTIVENKITLKREVTEEKSLPVKATTIEVNVPMFNGKAPIEVSVIANKLLATKGEDIGEVIFGEDNWNYDKENGKITIVVNNEKDGKIQNTTGEDEYTLIYRFEDYTEDITSKLERSVIATVEQYSGKENKIIKKEIKENQEIEVNVGELVTYSIDSTEEKIEKSRIYANYNSEEALYETEYTSNVTLNILTSDMLESIKINCSKESYKDINGFAFEAKDIFYKKIKFNYSEIKHILEKGGNIDIYNLSGEILYTLDNKTVQKEEDCTVNLNYANGIIVQINKVVVNGTINFEITKVMKKCNYEKSAFKNFVEIESKITAEVKYLNIDETLTLEEISTVKGLKESYTRANIYINKEGLTTIEDNENIEIKVELNNDKLDSDLYVNPSFEFVFPKYIKDVTVESMNLLYDNGLRISDFHTYTESDIVKMRVELSGVQKTFSESTITNGTNIVMNLKIKIDDYTPSKQDQIKLYYCNEGVSNYESQTKWTISKNIPNGILKTTNGFDVALIEYQAPNGMIAINGIQNYDGNLSSVQSVKQGEKMQLIPMGQDSRVAIMELLTLNNTGNECTDVVMIGRIPFKGNRDVISNEDLGTTTTGVMQDFIKEDIQNFNMTTIYYSNNEKANKDLNDSTNGWRLAEDVTNINDVKSYMIIVKGSMLPGAVLRYTYEFEIPENLPYEVSMAGSFGVYYNNNTDVAVVYESASADKVGLKTEAGPKIEATLSVDVGDGTEVGEARFLNYTLKVKNTGSVVAENVTVTNPIPEYTRLYQYTSSNGYGNNNYIRSDKQSLEWKIKKLEPEEEKTYTYMIKTQEIPRIVEYYSNQTGYKIEQDENGYYYEKVVSKEYVENEEDVELVLHKEKVYVGEVPDIFVKNKATVKVENLAIEANSNETSNLLRHSKFDIEVNTEWQPVLSVGSNFLYMSVIKNISQEEQKNVKVICNLPKTVEYIGPEVYRFNDNNEGFDEKDVEYNPETHTVTFVFDRIDTNEIINAYIKAEVKYGNNENLDTYYSVIAEDGIEEKSTIISRTYAGPTLEVYQDTNIIGESVLEGETVEFLITIENNGNGSAKNLKIMDEISKNLKDVSAQITGDIEKTIQIENGVIEEKILSLKSQNKIVLKISGIAVDLEENQKDTIIKSQAIIESEYHDTLKTEELKIGIKQNPERDNQVTEEEKQEENKQNQTQNKEENQNNNQNNNVNNDDQQDNSNNNVENEDKFNNVNNSNEQNKEQTSQNSNTANENKTPDKKLHTLSGIAWLDSNKNGVKEDDEKLISSLKVQLLKSGTMIKTTATDGKGRYQFADLTEGNYSVKYLYDGDKYTVTTYKNSKVDDSLNSEAIESTPGNAVSNNITINDKDITDVHIGLVEKDKFNLSINKYIASATVKTNKREEIYKYDNVQLGKVEIKAKELDDAIVTLEYVIEVKNNSEIAGKATSIIDYLPKDMQFDASKNEGWYLGEDGNVYNDSLKTVVIQPGEKKQFKLMLTKKMTEENTGVVVNKIAILNTENQAGIPEEKEDNTNTQEMIILVSTGQTIKTISITIVAVMFIILAGVVLHSKTMNEKIKQIFNRRNYK